MYALYGDDMPQLHQRLAQYKINDIIIKDAENSNYAYEQGQWIAYKVNSIHNMVDSTAAGDSFNAAYMAARLQGYTIAKAIKQAQALSRLVIQHKGAIIEKDCMIEAIAC